MVSCMARWCWINKWLSMQVIVCCTAALQKKTVHEELKALPPRCSWMVSLLLGWLITGAGWVGCGLGVSHQDRDFVRAWSLCERLAPKLPSVISVLPMWHWLDSLVWHNLITPYSMPSVMLGSASPCYAKNYADILGAGLVFPSRF